MVADFLSAFYPGAYATNKSAPGNDIGGVGKLAIEVKATATSPLLPALRQAHARALPEEIPIGIWRPNGYGEARILEWVVFTRVATFFGPIAERAGWFN
jgi:hypothetical protein